MAIGSSNYDLHLPRFFWIGQTGQLYPSEVVEHRHEIAPYHSVCSSDLSQLQLDTPVHCLRDEYTCSRSEGPAHSQIN